MFFAKALLSDQINDAILSSSILILTHLFGPKGACAGSRGRTGVAGIGEGSVLRGGSSIRSVTGGLVSDSGFGTLLSQAEMAAMALKSVSNKRIFIQAPSVIYASSMHCGSIDIVSQTFKRHQWNPMEQESR